MEATLSAVTIVTDDEGQRVAEALRRGDAGVLNELVDRYSRQLLRYLVHLTGDRTRAEDLFQETWLRVIERGHQYDPRHPFVAWLLTIARHLFVDSMRRRHLDPFPPAEQDTHTPEPEDAGPSPFEAALGEEDRERIGALIAALPVHYREVLYLRFADEMTLQEIARLTGVRVATVKSRLHRGLQHLADRLGGR